MGETVAELEAFLKTAKERRTEKPQRCKYCQAQATKSLLWAEGMAYIPVCDAHEQRGRDRIEKTNRDEVVGVHTIKQADFWKIPDVDVGKRFPESPYEWQADPDVSGADYTESVVTDPVMHSPYEDTAQWPAIPQKPHPHRVWRGNPYGGGDESLPHVQQLNQGNPWSIGLPNRVIGSSELPDLYHLAPTSERDRIYTHGLQPSMPALQTDSFRAERPDARNIGVYGYPTPKRHWQEYMEDAHPALAPFDWWRIPSHQVQRALPDEKGNGAFYLTHPVYPELHEGPEHRIGSLKTGDYQPYVPIRYHDSLNARTPEGTLQGHANRWPTIYDSDTGVMHIGPEGTVHHQVAEAGDTTWAEGAHHGWLGHNPEGVSDNRMTPEGDEYGWYSQGWPGAPPRFVNDAMLNYYRQNLSPQYSPATPGGFGHGQSILDTLNRTTRFVLTDNYTNDSREWPDPSEPRAAKPPGPIGCTCDDGWKLECPVHGMHATESDNDYTWSQPQAQPIGYGLTDSPRNWQQAHSRVQPVDTHRIDPPDSAPVLWASPNASWSAHNSNHYRADPAIYPRVVQDQRLGRSVGNHPTRDQYQSLDPHNVNNLDGWGCDTDYAYSSRDYAGDDHSSHEWFDTHDRNSHTKPLTHVAKSTTAPLHILHNRNDNDTYAYDRSWGNSPQAPVLSIVQSEYQSLSGDDVRDARHRAYANGDNADRNNRAPQPNRHSPQPNKYYASNFHWRVGRITLQHNAGVVRHSNGEPVHSMTNLKHVVTSFRLLATPIGEQISPLDQHIHQDTMPGSDVPQHFGSQQIHSIVSTLWPAERPTEPQISNAMNTVPVSQAASADHQARTTSAEKVRRHPHSRGQGWGYHMRSNTHPPDHITNREQVTFNPLHPPTIAAVRDPNATRTPPHSVEGPQHAFEYPKVRHQGHLPSAHTDESHDYRIAERAAKMILTAGRKFATVPLWRTITTMTLTACLP